MRSPIAPFIVGVGASAGGVEALKQLFKSIPPESGLAFVVVTHLGAGRESSLPEILALNAAIPVAAAAEGDRLVADRAYIVAVAGATSIEDGVLRLRPTDPGQRRHPIDGFLASLAQDQGDRAIGVVLSGSGSDGTLGLKAIKERGGLTLAQGSDGTAPQYPSMPETAVAAGAVDLVLPVQDMPDRLRRYAAGQKLLDGIGERNVPGGTGVSPTDAALQASLLAAKPDIAELVRASTGHDFGGYKDRTFLRRVQRRMHVQQVEEPEAYVARLRTEPAEIGLLFRDLLIGVTGFLRDADAFAALRDQIVPKLFANTGSDGTVRVWVPGCSTGEEAFSIAMLLHEHAATLTTPPRIQVFATDIDEAALGVARAGRYPAAMLNGALAPDQLQRFFVAEGDMLAVAKPIRELCIFSAHSVIRDPPFSRLDLISCRNLLIYLGGMLQRQLLPVFHYALRPGGHLFLGMSEGIGTFGELFTSIDKKNRLFRRRDDVPSEMALPLRLTGLRPTTRLPAAAAAPELRGGMPLRPMVEKRVLDRFAPAHVIVNRDGEVLYYSARTGKYLEAPVGAPSGQLLAIARRGLRSDLRAAFQEAVSRNLASQRARVAVELDDRVQLVTITVEPLSEPAESLLLVVFADVGAPISPEQAAAEMLRGHDGAAAEVEREVRDLREKLQGTVEEYETGLEELRSANEELVSMNEELQSTNEELQTTKEEQQSVNEELQTVNHELNSKIEALARANADLRNLFESTRVATVFLDRRLMIRGFTPSAAALFNLRDADRGRPLTEIVANVDYPELRDDIEGVLRSSTIAERPVISRDGQVHYLARLLPYAAEGGETDGVVVTLADITSVNRAAHQRMLVLELNHRVKNTLAVVAGIANASLAPGEPRNAFLSRLRALARAHDLLARDNWNAVPLREIMTAEAAPYAIEGYERIRLQGDDLSVSPRTALALGMVLHELATNAAKYGALSVPDGFVALGWSAAESRLHIFWRESGGPPVVAPTRIGFGSRVIDRQVRAGLQGQLLLDYAPEGVRATIEIPLGVADAVAVH